MGNLQLSKTLVLASLLQDKMSPETITVRRITKYLMLRNNLTPHSITIESLSHKIYKFTKIENRGKQEEDFQAKATVTESVINMLMQKSFECQQRAEKQEDMTPVGKRNVSKCKFDTAKINLSCLNAEYS